MSDLLTGAVPATTLVMPTAPVIVEVPEYLKNIEMDADIKSDPMLKTFKNVGDVFKSYVHAKRMIGAEKLPVPTKNSTPSEWKEVFHKLGLPQDVKDFIVNKKDGSKVPEDFISGFKDKAYAAGILPQQAQSIMDFYEEQVHSTETKLSQEYQLKEQKDISDLKLEWGASFDTNLKKANFALGKYGNEGMVKLLEETGLGNSAHLIRFLAKVTDSVSEDKFKGDSNSVDGIEQVKSQMNAIRSNRNHAYYDKSNAGHQDAISLMESLAQKLHQ